MRWSRRLLAPPGSDLPDRALRCCPGRRPSIELVKLSETAPGTKSGACPQSLSRWYRKLLVSARVANGGLARPARSLVLRGPGRRRLGQGEQGAG